MEYQKLIETMSGDTYQNLKRALELGKWPDGKALSREQRENTMQAVIAWGRLHLAEEERVGYINKKHKEGDACDEPTETTLTWKD
ncbi:MAG: DUF1315 family protein [Proteobacteria bacterium]|nr:DUF1315 family protein [Pseudomonadota bacterium]